MHLLAAIPKPALLFLFLYLLISQTVFAQSGKPLIDAGSRTSAENDERMGSPEKELAYRALIARADSEYKLNLKRASDSATLALSLQRDFKQTRSLSAAQFKNLQHIEKLARRIRGYAGGSDDGEMTLETNINIEQSLSRIADAAMQLQREVEKTSRQVVSAKIIASANELISLVRHTRNLLKP